MNIAPDPGPAVAALLDTVYGAEHAHGSTEVLTRVIDGLIDLGWSKPGDPAAVAAAERQARVEGAVRATTEIQTQILSDGPVDYRFVQRIEDRHVREYRNGYRPFGVEDRSANALDVLEVDAATRALEDAKRTVLRMADERLEQVAAFRADVRPDLRKDSVALAHISEAETLDCLAPQIAELLNGLISGYNGGRRPGASA